MKKSGFVFAAFLALSLASCVTSKAPLQNNESVKVSGRLQVNDNNSYFIIVGGDGEVASKYAKTFFLTKDKKRSDAWKTLVSNVGKAVVVHGTVVKKSGEWVKTVAVDNVSIPE